MYFHAFIKIKKDEKEQVGVWFNLTDENVRSLIVKPYLEGKKFHFVGEAIDPSEIEDINIFCSDEFMRI